MLILAGIGFYSCDDITKGYLETGEAGYVTDTLRIALDPEHPGQYHLYLRGDHGLHFPARVITQGCQFVIYGKSTDHPLYLLRLIGD